MGMRHFRILEDNQNVRAKQFFRIYAADNSDLLCIEQDKGSKRVNPNTLNEPLDEDEVEFGLLPFINFLNAFMGLETLSVPLIGGDRIVEVNNPRHLPES